MQDGTDGFFALEATTACVLEHDVRGHHLHHSLDVLLVEHAVEARNRGQYVFCEVHGVVPLIPRPRRVATLRPGSSLTYRHCRTRSNSSLRSAKVLERRDPFTVATAQE